MLFLSYYSKYLIFYSKFHETCLQFPSLLLRILVFFYDICRIASKSWVSRKMLVKHQKMFYCTLIKWHSMELDGAIERVNASSGQLMNVIGARMVLFQG